jgi:thioredoxin 1
MSNAVSVTTTSFEKDVLKSKVPVLVDFWAPWCMPCRMLAPVIDAVASEYEGKVKVLKLNTDEDPGLADTFGIRGIPTLILFKDGAELARMVGVRSKDDISALLDKALD